MSASVDPAVARARQVVGLYGDPDVSWSIVLALEFARALDVDRLRDAAATLVAQHPHLGREPEIVTYGSDESAVLAAFADRPYGDHDSLLRVALREDGRMLVVAAHHGALDGLGVLGAAAVLTGLPLTSSARGIERTAEPSGFLRAGAARVVEALTRPPLRLAAHGFEGSGDWLTARSVTATRPTSSALVAAAVESVRHWNETSSGSPVGRQLVLAMGLSRRPGSPTPAPTRDTAYVRLPVHDVVSAADAAAVMAATLPEPAFPDSDGRGLVPRLVRLLGSRLGATLLVSNLGRLEGEHLIAARLWPVAGGPAGAAVGLASAAGATTVTVRLRRNAFNAADAEELAALVGAGLERWGR